MDCIITAGGLDKPDSPMYAYTQGKSKALLDMNGRTMLERVVDALQGSRSIERIVVVGLGSDLSMTFQRPVEHVPDQGSMVQNAIAGIQQICKSSACPKPVLLCSADIPTIISKVDWTVSTNGFTPLAFRQFCILYHPGMIVKNT